MGNSRKFKVGDEVVITANDEFKSCTATIIGIPPPLNHPSVVVEINDVDENVFKREYLECYVTHRYLNSLEADSPIQKAIDYLEKLKGSEALDTQVGGRHYKDFIIQPAIFHRANDLRQAEANVIDYVLRHKNKNGKEDLDKAIHWIQMIKDMDYER